MNSIEDIIQMIMRNNGYDYETAKFMVEDCQKEMEFYMKREDWEMVEIRLADILGLEPDYIPILMSEIL